ncbi:hypothetical protein KAU11_03165 [Candidatus Babeliales bacterium]|nr:hypothetical protein [Candidatus Babeliales bacterium]
MKNAFNFFILVNLVFATNIFAAERLCLSSSGPPLKHEPLSRYQQFVLGTETLWVVRENLKKQRNVATGECLADTQTMVEIKEKHLQHQNFLDRLYMISISNNGITTLFFVGVATMFAATILSNKKQVKKQTSKPKTFGQYIKEYCKNFSLKPSGKAAIILTCAGMGLVTLGSIVSGARFAHKKTYKKIAGSNKLLERFSLILKGRSRGIKS